MQLEGKNQNEQAGLLEGERQSVQTASKLSCHLADGATMRFTAPLFFLSLCVIFLFGFFCLERKGTSGFRSKKL